MKKSQNYIDLGRVNKPVAPQAEPPEAAREEPAGKGTAEAPAIVGVPSPETPVAAPATVPKEGAPREAKPRASRSAAAAPAPAPVPAQAPAMPEPVVALGVRVPVGLHRKVKLYCIEHGIEMQEFAKDALTARLAALQGGPKAVE